MIRIEKYDPEQVYSVIHIDGKSKNYMVKRFVFENTAIGKQTSIISDENGSKLVIISAAEQVIVKIHQLKGKEQTPEAVEVNLTGLIDVKGMKAMGNRISQQPVTKVELLTETNRDEDEDEDNATDDSDGPDLPDHPINTAPGLEKDEEKPKEVTTKKIDFEITNPDDIDLGEKRQLDLF